MKGPFAMASDQPNTLARRAQTESHLPALLDLPGEIRNEIYEYALCVDHIQGTQYKAPMTGKTNNEYYTITSTYTMIFETRDSGNWRTVPQQLSSLLALQQTYRQTRAETAGLPFSVNVFYVGIHAIQHFVAVVPRRILDGVKVISIWKCPGHRMDQVGYEHFASVRSTNEPRIVVQQLGFLGGLPALEKVILRVRGGVEGMQLKANWQQDLQQIIELFLLRLMKRNVKVEMI
jgi:hypothetical protein